MRQDEINELNMRPIQVMDQTHFENESEVCESAKKELQRLSMAFPFWEL
jgi:hypothetical protein